MADDVDIIDTELAVIGGGPAGYTCAIRASELGLDVTLVEARKNFGGTCLYEGCIPAKILSQAAELIDSAHHAKETGVIFPEPKIDLEILRKWQDTVFDRLAKGIENLLKRRNVRTVHGHGKFTGAGEIEIKNTGTKVRYKNAIIATGSRIKELPDWFVPGIWSPGKAVKPQEIPGSLLVVGTIFYSLELALFYATAGSKVTVVEGGGQVLDAADRDVVDVVLKNCAGKFERVLTKTSVKSVEKTGDSFRVMLDNGGKDEALEFDRIIVGQGRVPNTIDLGLENTGVEVDVDGFLKVDNEYRTGAENIFAVGDTIRGPMMTHFATFTGKSAAEVAAGMKAEPKPRAIPGIAYLSPQIAWTGLTEREAKANGTEFRMAKFPVSALGISQTSGRTSGFVKVLFDPATNVITGMGIAATNAEELIGEGTLAIDLGATLEQLAGVLHPHPTLSEGIVEAAELALGKPTHIYARRPSK